MISFPDMGVPPWGRLGNQLFQYAFLRAAARRLKTRFYCPPWDGERIFLLNDSEERAPAVEGVRKKYAEPWENCGFDLEAAQIEDGTEVTGYFQTELYFPSREEVLGWYTFRPEILESVRKRYPEACSGSAVSLSLRIADDYNEKRDLFPLYPCSFYESALERLGDPRPVLVFTDSPERARAFFRPLLRRGPLLIEDASPAGQLCLQSLCRYNIITNSTFAWWGAWLNQTSGKRVICPLPWFRPGHRTQNHHIVCRGWEAVRVPVLPLSLWRWKKYGSAAARKILRVPERDRDGFQSV